ncbi:hypothetical protein F5Y14DRAFT_440036 [Nemania sp. NC0429]|nr:hypothetical protein F5Y14DRAFT_440036 [Nemania sp. NC0429]
MSRKGRPLSNIDEFRLQITELYEDGISVAEIYQFINEQGVDCTFRTLQRRIQAWNLVVNRTTKLQAEEIVHRIEFLFFVRGWKDKSIQLDLSKSGITISLRTITRIRVSHGMKRRYRTDEERAEAMRRAAEFLEKHQQRSSMIRSFGKNYLYEFVRTQAGVIVGRNQLYQYYKARWPESVRQRSQSTTFQHGKYVIPGRNFMWGFDGYMKLQKIGIEIYACIDAYSRMIIWIYVGPTACTSLSTLKQFLRTVSTAGIRPLFTRADMGVETALFAGAQGILAESDGTAIAYEGPNGEQRLHRQGNRLSSCHLWGTSKQNQKIEAWWRSLRMGLTDRWIIFADELTTIGLINHNDDRDLIAVYAIYGPILRTEVAEFVQLWNNHTIRTQKNRPHVVSGKPTEIYETCEVNWGIPIPEGSETEALLRTMSDSLENTEIDAFFTEETEAWCNAQLEELGFDGTLRTEEDHKYPHLRTYLDLRHRIRQHEASGNLPILSLIKHPIGGTNEFVDLLQRNHPLFAANNNLNGNPIPPDFLAGIEHDYYAD